MEMGCDWMAILNVFPVNWIFLKETYELLIDSLRLSSFF